MLGTLANLLLVLTAPAADAISFRVLNVIVVYSLSLLGKLIAFHCKKYFY